MEADAARRWLDRPKELANGAAAVAAHAAVRLLAAVRLHDESEACELAVAAVALRVLLDANFAALILPALRHLVAVFGVICHALRSAAAHKPELMHHLSTHELIACSTCQRRQCRDDMCAGTSMPYPCAHALAHACDHAIRYARVACWT